MPDNVKDNPVEKRKPCSPTVSGCIRVTGFGKRGLVLQHGEDDVSSFTLNPSWLSCEDETQRCIMVEIYLEP